METLTALGGARAWNAAADGHPPCRLEPGAEWTIEEGRRG
jgi:hypothetical protein